jgi:hypothetical protein
MKKIISFCLFGSDNIYCRGLIENIDLINKKYNDWEIYIYYENIPDNILDILSNKEHTKLFKCTNKNNLYEALLWRLYPLESNADIFISRDADSRITDREMKFINEWINSDKVFHIIRDHYKHKWRIMAGMFGIKIKEFNKLYNIKSIDTYIIEMNDYVILKKKKKKWVQIDQLFLGIVFWPLIKYNNMSHIAEECLRFTKNDIVTGYVSDFIGKKIFC